MSQDAHVLATVDNRTIDNRDIEHIRTYRYITEEEEEEEEEDFTVARQPFSVNYDNFSPQFTERPGRDDKPIATASPDFPTERRYSSSSWGQSVEPIEERNELDPSVRVLQQPSVSRERSAESITPKQQYKGPYKSYEDFVESGDQIQNNSAKSVAPERDFQEKAKCVVAPQSAQSSFTQQNSSAKETEAKSQDRKGKKETQPANTPLNSQPATNSVVKKPEVTKKKEPSKRASWNPSTKKYSSELGNSKSDKTETLDRRSLQLDTIDKGSSSSSSRNESSKRLTKSDQGLRSKGKSPQSAELKLPQIIRPNSPRTAKRNIYNNPKAIVTRGKLFNEEGKEQNSYNRKLKVSEQSSFRAPKEKKAMSGHLTPLQPAIPHHLPQEHAHDRWKGTGSRGPKDQSLPFLKEDHYTDVVLVVEGKKLYIHRCILGYCSGHFQKLLDSAVKASASSSDKLRKKPEVKISDHSYADMVELLTYLHPATSKDVSEKSAIRLLPIANRYGINALKEVCEKLLVGHLRKAPPPSKASKGPPTYRNRKDNTPEILLKCIKSADAGASKALMDECVRLFSNPEVSIKELKASTDISDHVKAKIYENRMENTTSKVSRLQNELEKEKQEKEQLQKQIQDRYGLGNSKSRMTRFGSDPSLETSKKNKEPDSTIPSRQHRRSQNFDATGVKDKTLRN